MGKKLRTAADDIAYTRTKPIGNGWRLLDLRNRLEIERKYGSPRSLDPCRLCPADPVDRNRDEIDAFLLRHQGALPSVLIGDFGPLALGFDIESRDVLYFVALLQHLAERMTARRGRLRGHRQIVVGRHPYKIRIGLPLSRGDGVRGDAPFAVLRN